MKTRVVISIIAVLGFTPGLFVLATPTAHLGIDSASMLRKDLLGQTGMDSYVSLWADVEEHGKGQVNLNFQAMFEDVEAIDSERLFEANYRYSGLSDRLRLTVGRQLNQTASYLGILDGVSGALNLNMPMQIAFFAGLPRHLDRDGFANEGYASGLAATYYGQFYLSTLAFQLEMPKDEENLGVLNLNTSFLLPFFPGQEIYNIIGVESFEGKLEQLSLGSLLVSNRTITLDLAFNHFETGPRENPLNDPVMNYLFDGKEFSVLEAFQYRLFEDLSLLQELTLHSSTADGQDGESGYGGRLGVLFEPYHQPVRLTIFRNDGYGGESIGVQLLATQNVYRSLLLHQRCTVATFDKITSVSGQAQHLRIGAELPVETFSVRFDLEYNDTPDLNRDLAAILLLSYRL